MSHDWQPSPAPWPHEVYVVGDWHNDQTAGVSVMCVTCDYNRIADGDDTADRMTLAQITEAIEQHERDVRALQSGDPMSEPTDPADRVVEWHGMSDYRRLPDGTWTETHWTFAPNSKPVRSAAPEENEHG